MAEEWDTPNYEEYVEGKTRDTYLSLAVEKTNCRGIARARASEQRASRNNFRGRGSSHNGWNNSKEHNSYDDRRRMWGNSRPGNRGTQGGRYSGYQGRRSPSGNQRKGYKDDEESSDNDNSATDSKQLYRGKGASFHNARSTRQSRGRGNTNRGQWKGSEGEAQEQRKKRMGYHQLKDLLDKEPNEIMLTLKSEQGGFSQLLQRADLNTDLLVMVIELLARATESTQRHNLLGLMTTVGSSQQFIFVTLLKFLMEFRMNKTHRTECNINAIFFLVQFLLVLIKEQPATACTIVRGLLPHIKDAVDFLLNEDYAMDYAILEMIEDLESVNERNLLKISDKDQSEIVRNERLQSKQPPESYRGIPIYPTEDDIQNKTPFLRPNIVDGKYLDAEHYLDVQFRLLREDSVRTLREGITEFRNMKDPKKIQGFRVYTSVSVLYPKCTINGIAHAISFDVRKMRNLRWENSKRLLEGSLVCLSKDSFQTMIFATVTKRDVELLQDGILFVRFEEYNEEVKTIRPYDDFVMVETSAFFEAYRHVLLALQNMHEHNFPFKSYIVELNENIQPPKYLREATKFDLRPLICDIPSLRVCDGGDDFKEVVYSPLHDYVKAVSILDPKAWPPPYEMSMDQSQQDALRNALTRELAVIQGPPGTGKTYIGLRLVQALLQNINVWRREREFATILIVCFTNHALDQFLEGILLFTSSLVRVGMRSQSTVLKPFTLSELRQDYRNRKSFPRELMANKKENLHRLEKFEKEIHKLDLEINRACQDMLTEIDLKPDIILKTHEKTLKRGNGNTPEFLDLHNDRKLILDWLGLRFRERQAQAWFSEQTQKEDFTQEVTRTPKSEGPVYRDREVEASLEFYEETSEDMNIFRDYYNESDEEEEEEEDDDDSNTFLHEPDEYWELHGGEKARRNYLTKQLRQRTMMTKEQEEKIDNVWNLSLSRRWELYRLWCSRYIMKRYDEITKLQGHYQVELDALAELRHACDLHILKNASVIGMTTTGAAKNKKLIQDLKPAIVIVEEAAEVIEAHIVTCLTEDTQHIIMIGDHQQLRPIPSVYMLAKSYNLDVSLFERLVNNRLPFSQLSIQHRMHPSISKLLVPHIYKELKDHNDTRKYPSIKGIEKRMFFITHDFYETHEHESTSKVNTHEAKFLVRLSEYLLKQGYDAKQITILAAYSGQYMLIQKLKDCKEILKTIRVTTVDNYQGEENDIVLVSFVRSNADSGIGFLKTENRVCVALSRAKRGLYCIGNFRYIAKESNLWKGIVSDLDEEDAIGSGLPLYCQNHPYTKIEVQRDTDFDSAPEGGCTLPCDIRLPCGHKCPRLCHAYDKDHSQYECKVDCGKTISSCKKGHRCIKKCFQCSAGDCGPCGFRVLKELNCGHEMKMPCFQPPSEAICKTPCMKMLACHHRCTKYCGEPCTFHCKEQVTVLGACKHSVKVPCYKSNDSTYLLTECKIYCRENLSCEHVCQGTCSTCMQGRLHAKCKEKCGKVLVCGHICQEPCSKNCPPCKQTCENRCKHNKCDKHCGVPCEPCREPCEWKCPHKKCTRLCGERCDRDLCKVPCPKKLNCKHPCVGLCGELCPKLCRICHKAKLTEVFFGREEDDDARFIMLRDCQHVFELFGFFQWLESQVADGTVQIPRCPRCKTVIRDHNGCLGDSIKTCLTNVNLVKIKCFGRQGKNSQRQRDLKIISRDLNSKVCKGGIKPALQIIETQLAQEKLGENQLVLIENFLNILQELDNSCEEMGRFHLDHLSVLVDKQPLAKKLDELTKEILEFITTNIRNPSNQQIEDVSREVHRFQLLARLIRACSEADKKKSLGTQDNQRITATCIYLLTPTPLPCNADEKVKETIKFLNMSRGLALLNLTDREKIVIVKAIGLKQGQWFKCPNGHVYCIGECGGAMEESKCPDCGAKIGGLDHRLQDGNTLADEMDGAAYPAYSDIANLQNYDIEEDWFDKEE